MQHAKEGKGENTSSKGVTRPIICQNETPR